MESLQILFHSSEQLTARKIFDIFHNQATKKFGQNFIFDANINKKIVACAGDLTDKVVLEIGPGPGGLTLEILRQPINKLYVIEVDHRWAVVWKSLACLFDGKLEVIEQDALMFDTKLVSPQVIISNLPYNISTALFTKWLAEFDAFEILVLMFQKEVADRLYAQPSTKAYSKLSVLTQWKTNVEKMFDLGPGCFVPPPKVKSTVVRFKPKTVTEDYYMFSSMVNKAFTFRRKMLCNTLKELSPNISQILQDLGYAPTVRAEEITVEDYQKLVRLLKCYYS